MDFAENKQQQVQQQEPVKKTRLDLGGGQTHDFGLYVENENMGMFEDRETASKSYLRSRTTELKTNLDTQLKEGANFAERRVTETEQFHVASARLCKDTVWFRFTDSPEMIRVKKTVNFLNNLLDQNMEKYVKQEGAQKAFDTTLLKNELDTAFDEAHKACVHYIFKKDSEGKAKKSHGVRRRQKVVDMMKAIEIEKPKYDALVEAIRLESLTETSVEKNKQLSPRELSTKFRSSVVIGEAEWQNEGNSTDVYCVTIMEDGQPKQYFLKRNLPLISADINGFLKRRTEQLQISKERHVSPIPDVNKKEEARLKKAEMDVPDYDAAIKFLEALKKKRNDASVATKSKVDDTITAIFRHDFDRMFNELQMYNTAIDYAVNNTDIDWKKIAADPQNNLCGIAKFILKIRGEQEGDAADENQPKAELKKKNALEWMLENFKDDLDKTKDADIIRALEEVHKADEAHGLERLFRVMLGKEVELFGQMRDRGKGDEREQSAANNSGVYRIAEIAGLTDVVTASDIRIVRFTDRDGKTVEDFCTVTEAAPGAEFLTLLKKAESEHKRIDYSPEAVRSLMRLQALDTVTRQVDRHGRNFKCNYREMNGRIIIDSIMSYDQDMSFAEESLKDTFKVNEDGSLAFQGFLPPMTTKIKKDSAFFKYLKYERFKMIPNITRDIKRPHLRFSFYISDTKEEKEGDEMSLCLPFFKHHEFADRNLKIDPDLEWDFNKQKSTHGKVYKIPADVNERIKFDGYMGTAGRKKAPKEADKYMLSGEELDKVTAELGTIICDIKDIVVRGDSAKDNAEREALKKDYQKKYDTKRVPKYATDFKTKYTDEEKKKLCEQVYKLKRMYDTYDFRFVSPGIEYPGMMRQGKLDLWIQQFMYFFVNAFKDDTVVIEKFYSLEDRFEETKPKDALLKELQDEKGDITLPTFLHYDLEAYEGLKKLASDETLDLMKLKLKALDFNEKKILMNKLRAKEMLDQIDEAKEKAEIFYKLMGWTESPQCKFFLTKDDYKSFNDINELAVDPGKTYLSIDNQNYMYGVPEFAKYVSDNEFEQAFKAEEKKRHDPKRWADPDFGINDKDEYDHAQTMMKNPVRGTIDGPKKAEAKNKAIIEPDDSKNQDN